MSLRTSANHFTVDVGGVTYAVFQEMSGGKSESEVIEFREVNKDGQVIRNTIAGNSKQDPYTLRAPVTESTALWEWRKKVEEGRLDEAKTDLSIIMYDARGEEVLRWNLFGGWPSSFKYSDLKADENSLLTQEIQITCDRAELQQ